MRSIAFLVFGLEIMKILCSQDLKMLRIQRLSFLRSMFILYKEIVFDDERSTSRNVVKRKFT